jgi:Cys-tRNA(Pro) deacylase
LTALEFEAGATATAASAAERIGSSRGQIAKTLLFLGRDGRLFMVVAPGDRRVSAAKLKAATGTKSRMARADEALAATGFSPGGVCPFGVDPAIPILIDRGLKQYDTIYPAAGTDSSGVPMTFAQLVAITRARVEDLLED